MKNLLKIVLIIVVFVAIGIAVFWQDQVSDRLPDPPNVSQQTNQDTEAMTLFASGLDTPWAIVFLPGGDMLVTERKGTVRKITSEGLAEAPVATLAKSREAGEGGLLGITRHPNFNSNKYIYLYYTYSENAGNTLNRVIRMRYTDGRLMDEEVIVDQIPGASNHNGGRIKFGPDGYLYITTGDAQVPSLSQNTGSLAGKILRVTENGESAPGNPFNNHVYSYGHRNSQGLAWDEQGRLWATEHGRSGVQSGLDEINLIEPGKNYGWPNIQGDDTRDNMERPYVHSGANETWAPAGIDIKGDQLFFGGLRGQALYELNTNSESRIVAKHFSGQFGRIREVIVGPDGMLYIATSNRDGRGVPAGSDDRIIRINPSAFSID